MGLIFHVHAIIDTQIYNKKNRIIIFEPEKMLKYNAHDSCLAYIYCSIYILEFQPTNPLDSPFGHILCQPICLSARLYQYPTN
jgi:hypothetical protein